MKNLLARLTDAQKKVARRWLIVIATPIAIAGMIQSFRDVVSSGAEARCWTKDEVAYLEDPRPENPAIKVSRLDVTQVTGMPDCRFQFVITYQLPGYRPETLRDTATYRKEADGSDTIRG